MQEDEKDRTVKAKPSVIDWRLEWKILQKNYEIESNSGNKMAYGERKNSTKRLELFRTMIL